MAEKATISDYEAVQGEMPVVTTKGKLKVVTYSDGTEIPSHINHGTVILATNDGPKEFEVDLLRGFHGDPCERQSASVGGDRYQKKHS